MEEGLTGKVLGLSDNISNFWAGINLYSNPFMILDILLVAIIIYWGYKLIKETRAIRILYGIAILGALMLLGQILHLNALNFILKYLVTMILVAIPVVFQPELRAALEKLGRGKIVADFTALRQSEVSQVIEDLIKAVKILSKNKTGALIVLVQRTGLKDIIEKGVNINAKISSQLITTIFAPNSPLHDGAIIISGNKILAASCMLPLSEDEFDFDIGTRHRAAVGLSSQTDALVVIVSEQSGGLSLSYNGQLIRDLASKELEEMLKDLLQKKSKKEIEKITPRIHKLHQ